MLKSTMNSNALQYILLIFMGLLLIAIWLTPMILDKFFKQSEESANDDIIENNQKKVTDITTNINQNAIQILHYSDFITKIQNNEIATVTIKTNGIFNEIISIDIDDNKYVTEIITSAINDLMNLCKTKNIHINVEQVPLPVPETNSTLKQLVFTLLPTILIILFLSFSSKQASQLIPINDAESVADVKTKFADVMALEAEKKEVSEVVEFLQNPDKFKKMGATIPKGLLFIGPPGNGKTLLARAVAGEADVLFLYTSGSSFVDTFVGVGARKVKNLFERAAEVKNCIIFIDEIDTIGTRRDSKHAHSESINTLNELLAQMDGFKENTNIIVIAATNRHESLDPALLRRFTRHINIPNPDMHSRRLILKHYASKIQIDENVDLDSVANLTTGASSAVLKSVINEAAILASRANRDKVTMAELYDSITRVTIGLERKNLILTADDKKLTAYHESGHAVVAAYVPHSIPVYKITITPRGQALGYVQQLEEDKVSVTIAELKARLVVAMGGMAAEMIKNGKDYVTTGPGSDIEQATKIAMKIVYSGFSDTMGPVKYSNVELLPESYKHKLMEEVQKLIVDARNQAVKILQENKKDFEKVAQELLAKETLTAEEFHALLSKKPYYLSK